MGGEGEELQEEEEEEEDMDHLNLCGYHSLCVLGYGWVRLIYIE